MVTLATFAQGTVDFNNRNIGLVVDAPVTFFDPTGPGVGTGYNAGLFFNRALVPLSVTTFRGDAGELAKYVIVKTVALPGTVVEQLNVPVEMRVWPKSFSSFETTPTQFRGSSGELVIAQLGGKFAANHLPPTFKGIVVEAVPEPSVVAIAFLSFALISRTVLRR